MYAIYEESGKFHTGRVMSEAESSMQIELETGRRVKVKTSAVLLKFDQPTPAELLAQANALMSEIDLDLAWEFAPDNEFTYADLARDYFSARATLPQQVAALLRLFEAPHYFRRIGRGQFKKAPEETVKAALLAIERKKQVQQQILDWSEELIQGRCPELVQEQLYKILFKPDKNAPEYKAVVEASKRSQKPPLDLLKTAGAITSPYQFHWRRFLFENFAKGTGFPTLPVPAFKENLPLATVQAFSIDDSSTTEIDDALSVQGLGSGQVTLGIHIAAPSLGLTCGDAIDKIARDRLSTVYMPGFKITMLPDTVVAAYTLQEGRACPAVSLYVVFNEETLECLSSKTVLEQVPIALNMRHDKLTGVVTEASLKGESVADYPFATELAFCFRLAQHLKAQREAVRGKPEIFNRPDYNFALTKLDGAEPQGDEAVEITVRQRGAPLDLIVAEAMILANSTWGAWMAQCGVPGIYRSQASMAPGVKVRMGVKPAPHAGMGVAQYSWATSPLRRYVDMVNQWQIIACAKHGMTAALAAPFKPKDVTLFAIISSFDAAYAAYNTFQTSMERYWTLQYLAQHQLQEVQATVLKEGWVRADTLPLMFKAIGADSLPRGAHVQVRITGTDLLTLDVFAQVVARLDDTPPLETAEESLDEEMSTAAPLTLAIDVQDAQDEVNPPVDAAVPPTTPSP
jgi:exoribonuclease II